MTTITPDQLAAIEEIKRLKARYFRSVDTFDLEGWLDVFTDTAKLTFELGVYRRDETDRNTFTVETKTGIADFWNSNSGRLQSVHHGHMPEIEIVSDTEARGIWAMEDIVEYADSLFHGYGHYWETYRKVDGQWKIDSLHLTRTRVMQTHKNQMVL
jgi:SnoaL-like protein